MKVLFESDNFVYDENLINLIANECGVLKDTARLLVQRNINTVEKAKVFLNPDKKYFYNPFLLKGVSEAVERIKRAKDLGQRVLIFGDYDADGICAATVLYYSLRDFGLTAYAVLPEREDGYGINADIIKKIREKNHFDLLITVDCGICEVVKIDELKNSGIDVIVTDHHEPPEVLPSCVCINPKIVGQEYPFNGLCGAGVAYKLSNALIGKRADEYLDFVAVATVADSMDLVDENRNIVYEGLKILNSNKLRTCFKYCLPDLKKDITTQTIAFSLAPRINAGGRVGDANSALDLFLEEDEKEKFNLAVRLNTYNIQRQNDCDQMYNEARQIVTEKKLYNDSAILVYNEKWTSGVVGIVAARLMEDYARPVIVFAGYNGKLKGSARSLESINIYDALYSIKDILIEFGGHSQAAGVTIEKKDFTFFKKKLLTYFSEVLKKEKVFEKRVSVEWKISGAFNKRFAEEIELMEPFGVGNKKPLFLVEAEHVKASPLRADSPHVSFSTPELDFLHFNGLNDLTVLNLPIKKSIVFETNVSEFRNKKEVKGFVKNIICDFSGLEKCEPYFFEKSLDMILKNSYEKQHEKISLSEALKKDRVCFVSSYFNREFVEKNNLPVYVSSKNDRSIRNCFFVLPCGSLTDFNKIVYVGKRLFDYEFTGESFELEEYGGNPYIDGLSLERSDFIPTYNFLKSYSGKEFTDIVKVFSEQDFEDNIYQFIFATKVFTELNFFTVKNGVLKTNVSLETKLTDSKIYKMVAELKG